MALSLLNNFLDNGAASASWSEKLLMLNEGRRVVFISYQYNSATGKLKYAASVFRRDSAMNDMSTWTKDEVDMATKHQAIVWLGEDGNHPYYELTEQDVNNHMHTTSERYRIRPVRLTVDTGMSYHDVIHLIRWEMCHGAGCKGPRRSRSRVESDDAESDCSFLSTDSQSEMSSALARVKTVHQVRYCGEDRDIFIAFKGRSQSGEIAYGAAIHRRSDPDDRLSEDEVSNHWKTAHRRLERSPVIHHLSDENKEYSHQLKRNATHREDITVILVDNIFTRRGGRIQVRSY